MPPRPAGPWGGSRSGSRRRPDLALLLLLAAPPGMLLAEGPPAEVTRVRTRFEAARAALVPFCSDGWDALERDLRMLEGRARAPQLQQVRGRWERTERPVDPAPLAAFEEALDQKSSSCRASALEQLRRALDEVREALGNAPTDSEPAAARLRREGVEMLEGFEEGVPADDRLVPALDAAARFPGSLERALRGAPCDEELAAVLNLLAQGSVDRGLLRLSRLLPSQCVTARRNEDVRLALLSLADGVLGRPPTLAGAPVDAAQVGRAAAVIAELVPARRDALRALAAAAPSKPAPAAAPAPVTAAAVPSRAPAPAPVPRPPETSAEATRADASVPWLALDVWQSAWGDFSEIELLLDYLRRNRIREVYLNPGIGMNASMRQAGRERVSLLAGKLRSAGVATINFLYAETNYPVGEFAAFLRANPELGIRMIADDSEFTDSSRSHFELNLQAVRAEGIRYAAFVTVEVLGNSGVSDDTRRWAIETLDETIAMSYFSCDLEGQKAALEPLFLHADVYGRKKGLKVAILAGSKSFGKEVSCEKRLGASGLPAFLRELHEWARRHPSYGGIVLETNERTLAFDVSHEAR